MAREKAEGGKQQRLSYIAVPSQIIRSLSTSSLQSFLLLSPPKKSASSLSPSPFNALRRHSPFRNINFLLLMLFAFAFVGTLRLAFRLDPIPLPCSPLAHVNNAALSSLSSSESTLAITGRTGSADSTANAAEFWRQPDGMGYKPCLDFSKEYRMQTDDVISGGRRRRKKYLLVVVNGGLNQQRNQIVDAVVIARILGAVLVVPVLQVNQIWGDQSEFADIFDLDNFKRVLADDVKVVNSLPSTHIRLRPVEEKQTPLNVSPDWYRKKYLERLKRDGVLLLTALDSRLSKDLPSDLQKLRCKVAFRALRFAVPVQELGNKLAARMRSQGPYLALHLRLEKDVWVRTGCLPGISSKLDEAIRRERKIRPELLTGRSNMTYQERKLAGLCPLNALDVTRLLKALEAPADARIYWAGGEPFGGREALRPLISEYPHLYNKEKLSLPGELDPFANKASILAAIDYIVCEQSDVFMASHGGNMGHLLQGHRAFAGHRKFITPNKRQMIQYFLDTSLPESDFNRIIKDLHRASQGEPEIRKGDKDVTAYPVPECMCNGTSTPIAAAAL